MRPGETSLGGGDRSFPQTTQGIVSDVRNGSALETVSRRYWKPIYIYLRAAWSKGNDDAKDLTQAFLLWLFESGSLKQFDPERGSLRGYPKVLLKTFVLRNEKDLNRLKRGGGIELRSLDGQAGLDESLPDPRGEDPDAIFDRTWKVELVDHAIGRVKQRCAESGRSAAYQVFELFDLGPDVDRPTYKEIASRLNLSDADVKRFLFQIREEVRNEIRREVAETTPGEELREDEWRRLFES